jgi:hypothetical protein
MIFFSHKVSGKTSVLILGQGCRAFYLRSSVSRIGQTLLTISNSLLETGNTKGGKYPCTIDLLFDWFGLVCFANKKQKLSVVIQLIPNQSNRRSMAQ